MAYSPPAYDEVDHVMAAGYTPDTYDDIDFVMDEGGGPEPPPETTDNAVFFGFNF